MGYRIRVKAVTSLSKYHSLLPMHLQDVLREAVSKHAGIERFSNPVYVEQLNDAIRQVKDRYPQAFK